MMAGFPSRARSLSVKKQSPGGGLLDDVREAMA